jgi:hypothetical protein
LATEQILLGKILVDMGLVSQQQIDRVLKTQEEGERRPLGSLLTEAGILDAADLKKAIEIQQANMKKNREARDRQPGMRFGDIAVEGGYIKSEQLNQCLRQQGVERGRGKEAHLGQIMIRLKILTVKQVLQILEIQHLGIDPKAYRLRKRLRVLALAAGVLGFMGLVGYIFAIGMQAKTASMGAGTAKAPSGARLVPEAAESLPSVPYSYQEVRKQGLDACRVRRPSMLPGPETDSGPPANAATEALAALAKAALGAKTAEDRQRALASIEEAGDPTAIPLLLPALSRDTGAAAEFEKVILGLASRTGRTAYLIQEIRKTDGAATPAMKINFAEILRETRSSEAEDILAGYLQAENAKLRQSAIDALAAINPSDRAAEDLIGILGRTGAPDDQIAACRALANIGCVEAIYSLIKLLEENDPQVAPHAYQALMRISGFGFPQNPERWRAWMDAQLQAGPATFERLTKQLESDSPTLAIRAIEGLSQLPFLRKQVYMALLPLAGHENDRIRNAALDTIGYLTTGF